MTLLRTAIAVPAFLIGVLAFQRIDADSQAYMIPIPNAPTQETPVTVAPIPQPEKIEKKVARKAAQRVEPNVDQVAGEKIVQRRLRIEGLLSNLDHVAAVAMQMKPEESDRLEPIIVDLAERTLELVDAEQLADPSADLELDDLEDTLKGLMQALTRQFATEATL